MGRRNNEHSLGENAFPKISGKPKDFLKQLENLKAAGNLSEKMVMEGTVKLHGSHADIVFDLNGASEEVLFQSRNRVCDPTDSQLGWPSNIAKHSEELHDLRDAVLARFENRNPDIHVDQKKPLIIAGEWIGPKVQKDVGVSELTHRFVTLAIRVNGDWQRDTDYADIEAPAASIYNVLRVPQYYINFDTANLTMSNTALLDMQKLADQVEAECPFAASFGIAKSRGEGIVWKPGTSEARADAKYWLKTKGPIIGPENRIQANYGGASGTTVVTAQDVQKLATGWVTERRLQQAYEYLTEMAIDQRRAPKEFRKWIAEDVFKEETTEIEELKSTFPGVEQVLRRTLGKLAEKAWRETSASLPINN